MQFSAQKKTAEAVIKRSPVLSGDVLKNFLLSLVDNILCASHTQIKFLCQLFKRDAVKQPSPQDGPVTLRISADDPFMQQIFNIAPAEVGEAHACTFPVPLQLGHVRIGLLLLFFRTLTIIT